MTEPTGSAGEGTRSEIGGRSLAALREQYRSDLFDDYLPFWDAHGIDHELGGFMCSMDHDGSYVDTSKRVWYQGRGLWTYAFLYNEFGCDRYLEVARKARDFLVRHGRDANGDWVACLDREGRVTAPFDGVGYGALFVAEGLQEYARATGDQASMDLCIQSLWRAVEIIEDPSRDVPQPYAPVSYPGMRLQGYEMVKIVLLSQVLRQCSDPGLEELSAKAVEAVIERFWNPEYQLNNEVLDASLGRPDDENEDFVYLGHAIETMWMILYEALRLGDRSLFDLAADRLRRHLEVAWDPVYGGFFRSLRARCHTFVLDKVLWLQEEVLIGTLALLEHTELAWPEEWFHRTFDYVHARFPLAPHGHPLWAMGGDRKVAFEPHVSRKGNYHHPRHLMLNLLAIERMVGRGGRVSAVWK